MVRLCRLLGLYEAITAALIRVGAPVWQDCLIFARNDVSDGDEIGEWTSFSKFSFDFTPQNYGFILLNLCRLEKLWLKDYTRDLDKSKEGVILSFYLKIKRFFLFNLFTSRAILSCANTHRVL